MTQLQTQQTGVVPNEGENSSELQLKAYEQASKRLSPAWDVKDYVAVNPFFGVKDVHFLTGIKYFELATGQRLLPPLEYYRERYDSGDIQNGDLTFAIQQLQIEQESGTNLNIEYDQVLSAIRKLKRKEDRSFLSLSDLYDREKGRKMNGFITEEISKWLSSYFDLGQAVWKMPGMDQRLYVAWKQNVEHDSTFDSLGIQLKSFVKTLPNNPQKAFSALNSIITSQLSPLSFDQWTNYYFRLLCSVFGWSSYIKRYEFEAERDGDSSWNDQHGGILDLLVIRMAFDVALIHKVSEHDLFADRLTTPEQLTTEIDSEYVWLLAEERSHRKKLLDQIHPVEFEAKGVPDAQMVFCIDLRSEVMRRHIEHVNPQIQTYGFAGFFGVTAELKAIGHEEKRQQCPVLLKPSIEVHEDTVKIGEFKKKKKAATTLLKLLRGLQKMGNSCFSYVESFWLTSLWNMLTCSSAAKKPNIDPYNYGLSESEKRAVTHSASHLALDTKVTMAHGLLKALSLTERFSEFVILVGHGSESANNPHASGLDCGACAGHSGEMNASVMAAVLNEREVRVGLFEKHSIEIPNETLFLAGVHNTTREEITLNKGAVGAKRLKKLQLLEGQLRTSCALVRKERLAVLPSFSRDPHQELTRKANDWSEVRPELGLVNNSSFIIARRGRTKGSNLWGRSFLHEYNEAADTDGAILEQILTAPMVVTNWINMQYYASTVNQEVFGAGNKVLHNVVGMLGVYEGNRSDLRIGLGEQSVHYKGKYLHQPLRLQVVVEATKERLHEIVLKHQVLRDLIMKQWVVLVSIDPNSDDKWLFESNGWLKL